MAWQHSTECKIINPLKAEFKIPSKIKVKKLKSHADPACLNVITAGHSDTQ